jgi:hypothetical protein
LFRLIKLLISVVALAVFVWFGANVPLGSQTLFQHLQAIGRTSATKDLLDGTRESAKPLVDSVRRRIVDSTSGPATLPDGGGAPPAEDVSPTDKQRLKKLLAGEDSTDHRATEHRATDHHASERRPAERRAP